MATGIRLTFLGATRTVTGSCFLLNTTKGKLLVDCGMFQGGWETQLRNYLGFAFDPKEIDWVVLTHAHIDHCGLIPRLTKLGFNGRIFATSATADLAKILLLDSAHIQEHEAEQKRLQRVRRRIRPEDYEVPLDEPLYTQEDAKKAGSFFEAVDYRTKVNLNQWVSVRFDDAGHILGSASAEVWVEGSVGVTKVVFSGDIGNYDRPILADPSSIESGDYVLIESTYGHRMHEGFDERDTILEGIIDKTVGRASSLVIPAFAVGRTQDILYALRKLKDRRPDWPALPVFVDSPLASQATAVTARHPECFDDDMRRMMAAGDDPFHFEGLKYTETEDESKAISRVPGPKIIISASGMCTDGRIKHHLKEHLPNPKDNVMLVGYQAEGTLGRMLHDHLPEVSIFGDKVKVRAGVTSIGAFSAHADQAGLLRWLHSFGTKPGHVFVIHGEDKSAAAFRDVLMQDGYDAVLPEPGATYELEVGRPVAEVIPHPGTSEEYRIAKFQNWFNKEAQDLVAAMRETVRELSGWAKTQPRESALQGISVVFDDLELKISDIISEAASTFKGVFSSLEDGEKNQTLVKLETVFDAYLTNLKASIDGLRQAVFSVVENDAPKSPSSGS